MGGQKESGNEEKQPVEELSYEQAYKELEEIVSALESEEQTLDAALALYERGQALARRCAGLVYADRKCTIGRACGQWRIGQ